MSASAAIALAGILAHALGLLVYGAPKGPDVTQGLDTVLGTFLLYLSVLAAQLSWGRVLVHGRNRAAPIWERYFWGASLTLLAIGTLGFAPLVGAASAPGWRLFLLAGCAGALLLERRAPAKAAPAGRPASADLAAGLVIALAVIGAASPRSFWDSLWYHLPATRLWFEAGRIYLPPRLPIAFQTGFWDNQFLLGQLLLGAPGDGGLIAAHLFAQWASLGTAVFSFLLLRSAGPAFGLSPFAALAGLLGTELFFEAEFAKNDWAVVFWGLAAVAFLRERRPWAGALAAGLTLAIKLSSALFLGPWFFWLGWTLRRQPARLAGAAALALLAAMPLLARNAAFTGNPFFPALGSLFPSPLQGPSWNGIHAYTTPLPGLRDLGLKLATLAFSSAAVLGLLAYPWARNALPRSSRAPLLVAVVTVLLLGLALGRQAEWRFAGPGLVLAAAYGARCLELCVHRWRRARRWGSRALLAAVLVWFPVDWSAPSIFLRPDPAIQIREWVSGGAMAWVRLHATPGSAATLNETRLYYLFPGFPRRAFDDPELDRRLATARAAEELPGIFRAAGIRYLVLSAEFVDRAYDRRVCDWAYALSERNPDAVVFRRALSRVLDLAKLPSAAPLWP